MWRTYQEASNVITWLGQDDFFTDSALDALEWCGPQSSASEATVDSWAARFSLEDTAHIAALSRNSYFSRMWIVPEILNARRVTLCSASQSMMHSVPLYRLLIWHASRRRQGFCDQEDDKPIDQLQSLLQDLEDVQEHFRGAMHFNLDTTAFLRAAQRHSGRLCSDPRDKIFVLYGLPMFDLARSRPVPDYSMTLEQVALVTIKYLDQLMVDSFRPICHNTLVVVVTTLQLSLGLNCASPEFLSWVRTSVSEEAHMAKSDYGIGPILQAMVFPGELMQSVYARTKGTPGIPTRSSIQRLCL